MKPTVSDKHDRLAGFGQPHLARRRVERGEELIGGQRARLGQRIEQRRLAGVGVADERDAQRAALLARAALRLVLLLDLLQARLHRLDALADHAPVELDLRLARAAAQADAAGLALEVRPAPHQARGLVLQPRQLDLQLALMALSARGEDVEDQRGAVGHRHAEVLFEVALLRRRQGLVEDDTAGLMGLHRGLDLVGLARADEQRRIGRLALGGDAHDGIVAGRLRQQRQFVERGVERRARTKIHADQNGRRGHDALGVETVV